jgi:hypothetical protein
MTDTMEQYRKKLAGMTDDDLLNEVESKVWLSGYAANNPRSEYHGQCDATYDEAKRREKVWLYQRGWNAAFRSAGHTPTERDIEAAQSHAHDRHNSR